MHLLLKPPVFADRADEIIWRSTGWLGWNGMKLTCGVIRSRHLVLTPEDVSKLLLRYHRYALRFDLTIETVASDLHLLADTTSIDYARLAEAYCELSRRTLLLLSLFWFRLVPDR